MNDPTDRAPALKGALFLAALALLCYWPMLFGRVPFPAQEALRFPPWDSSPEPGFTTDSHSEMGDLVTEMYPWKVYTRRAATEGTLPLWNPFILFGTTFVGDPQPALFYPPTLLYGLLPTPLAWSLLFIFRTVLAGLLAALLARALGAEPIAALVSGIVFAFSGWVTAFQTRPHLDTTMWLALVLFAVDRLRKRVRGPSVALAAVAFALPVLAGQPESAAHVTLVGLIFFAYRLALSAEAGAPGRLRFCGGFAIAGLLALALAAVQIFPTLEFIGQLDRGLDRNWGARPLHEIAAFLSRDLGSNPNSARVPIPESAAYAGMLTLLLAPLALLRRNRRDAIFFLALLAGVLSIVYGRGPGYALSRHTPILRGIPNWRLLGVADLALALLAGLGLSALAERLRAGNRPGLRWWLLTVPVFTGAALGIGAILARGRIGFRPHPLLSLQTLRGPASSAGLLLAAALLLGLALAGRLGPRQLMALSVAFCAADLLTASYGFLPFCRPQDIFPAAPTFRFLQQERAPYRVASVNGTYPAGAELGYGLESAGGFNVIPRRTESMLSTFGVLNRVPTFLAEKIVASPGRLLDVMNVKYLVATTWNPSADLLSSRPDRFRLVFSDRTVRIFENLAVLPRAFLVPVSEAVVLEDERSELARLRSADFDPARSVILGELAAPHAPGPGTRPARSRVTGIVRSMNAVSLRAAAAEPSILVLSQTYYPGWKVFVDGIERPLLRVDYGLAGAALETGDHEVRFAYQPDSLRRGAILSSAALLICLILCVSKGRRQ